VDQFTAPLIYEGHVYVVGEAYTNRNKARALCVNAATGEVKWTEVLGTPQHSSPALADGKIFAVCGDTLVVFRATPERYVELAKVRLGLDRWSSPSVVDGRLYVHRRKRVSCYDLRK
jgi:outer membrane protein assembly factor BamB